MIVPSSGVKVLIAMKPVDFRKGMDGLAAVVHETLGANPFGGVIYVAVVARGGDAADAWATRHAAGGFGLGAGAWGANSHADGGFVIGCYIFQVTPTIGADSVRSWRRLLIRFPTMQGRSRNCSSPRATRTSV